MRHPPALQPTCPRCGQRASTKAEVIIAAVAKSARPLTTKQIATKLRAPAQTINSTLCKLANRGLVKREYRGGAHQGGGFIYCVWSAQPIEAPP